MKTIVTLLLFFMPAVAFANIGGTYSNRAEGFYVETLFVAKDSKAFYFVGVAGVPVTWCLDAKRQKITIRGNLGPNLMVEEREFTYDEKSDIVVSTPKASASDSRLANVSKEIPEKIQKFLDSFDWDFDKHVIGKAKG